MKTLLTLCILVLCLGCGRNSDPQPPPSTTQSTLTAEEQQVVGNWILKTTSTYDSQGNLLNFQTHTDSISCHLELRSTQNQANQPYNTHDCSYALSCSSTEGGWSRSGSYLTMIFQQHYILSLSTDSMTLKSPGAGYNIYLLTR
jgi:hypothetical protein